MHFWGECSIHTVMKKIKYYPRRWGERVDYTYPIQRVLTWGSFGTACFCTHTSKGFAAAQCRWTITPHDAELTVKTIRAPSGAIDPHCTSLARFKRWSSFHFANGRICIYSVYVHSGSKNKMIHLNKTCSGRKYFRAFWVPISNKLKFWHNNGLYLLKWCLHEVNFIYTSIPKSNNSKVESCY